MFLYGNYSLFVSDLLDGYFTTQIEQVLIKTDMFSNTLVLTSQIMNPKDLVVCIIIVLFKRNEDMLTCFTKVDDAVKVSIFQVLNKGKYDKIEEASDERAYSRSKTYL